MACVNTKALSKLFNKEYIQGVLSEVLIKQARISPNNKVIVAKLVEHGGQSTI